MPLIDELWRFASDPDSQFYLYHLTPEGELLGAEDLRRFLFATMDESRLRYASSYLTAMLRRTDLEDAEHFRRGLLRREIGKQISYQKQRDHSAHPLYNYLLGWYVYSNVGAVRDEIERHFTLRNETDPDAAFRDSWPFVSSLHDVGYLFEGALPPLDPAVQSTQVAIGAEVVHEYYNHRFWMECATESIHARKRLLALAEVQVPDYRIHSMTAVADSLRSLGDLSRLTAAVRRERGTEALTIPNPDVLSRAGGLPGDGFDLWEAHYRYYGLSSMVDRVASLRLMFRFLAEEGFGGTGMRVLDHGVCGGLLLLQYSTFYFNVRFSLGDAAPIDINDEQIWRTFRDSSDRRPGVYRALWWWKSVTWATAAVAFHNVLQSRHWPSHIGHLGPLRLNEDPIAYLGILVDCLQEWDRYSVSRETVIGGDVPLQGIDVQLAHSAGKVQVAFPEPEKKRQVTDALNTSLHGWTDILDLT